MTDRINTRCWILVVADDLATRSLVEDSLNRADYPTIAVANAKDAARWLHSSEPNPSLLIVEGQQNVLDSVRLRDLQQPEPQQVLPLVILQAPDDPSPQQHDPLNDHVDVLPKPANPDQIVAAAARYCNDR